MSVRTACLAFGILAITLLLLGCGKDDRPPYETATAAHPNILFIVWDTVRADRLSLYGHVRQTTPFLDRWAKDARVYNDCVAVGSTTVPSHASMFTGLMPSEHGVSNEPRYHILPDEFETLAELLKAAGYDTYAFVCNPFLEAEPDKPSLMQGFDLVEYPWDAAHQQEALRITISKIMPYDRTNYLAERVRAGYGLSKHDIKACGEQALPSLTKWLEKRGSQRPYFAFLNFMEAHAPLIPPLKYRRKFMTNEQIRASFNVDRSFPTLWKYLFGYYEYTPAELELTGLTYDAALLEEDEILQQFIEGLEAAGRLENTVVVLVGDHGEHLGEHHRLDHQYSVYEPLLRVPLVIRDPARFSPGRESRPAMTVDLFPTLLERVGLRSPVATKGVNLLDLPAQRVRLGEYLQYMSSALRSVKHDAPDFDPRPWMRTLQAFYHEPYKLIAASDDRHELYDLSQDPGELNNLIDRQPEVGRRLLGELRDYLAALKIRPPSTSIPSVLTPSQQQLLERLGYLVPDQESDEIPQPGTQARPGTQSQPSTQSQPTSQLQPTSQSQPAPSPADSQPTP